MANLLRQGLTEEGYAVTVAATASTLSTWLWGTRSTRWFGCHAAWHGRVHRRAALRERQNQVPILMLTARDAASDIVSGLDLGADGLSHQAFFFRCAVSPSAGFGAARANRAIDGAARR
jgi:hypothetical protein